MKKGYIYKITSPSGRSYIGQTNNIKRRFKTYMRLNCNGQPKLYRSLVKYGYTNHNFDILEDIIYDPIYLNYLESFYIRTLDTVDNGLNCNEGGFNHLMSNETKHKISMSMTEYCFNNIDRNQLNNLRPIDNTGKLASEYTRSKMSNSQKKRKDETKLKKSISAIGRVLSDETRSKISNTLKGNIPWNKGLKNNRKSG